MIRAAITLSLLVAAVAQPAAPIEWASDLAGARAHASRAHKPLLVLFRCET